MPGDDYQPDNSEESGGGFLIGLIYGALLGAVLGLLLAPSSGQQIRRHLKERQGYGQPFIPLIDTLRSRWQEAREEAGKASQESEKELRSRFAATTKQNR